MTVLGRSAEKIKRLFGDQVAAVTWDAFTNYPKHYLTDCELILNLAGANISEKRWNDQRKQTILQSRIDAT